jgi:hypothetical protein
MMESPQPSHPSLRASDADRERTAEALRRHHVDGRLDTDELQERLGRCYAARTMGELAALVADLPGDEPPAAPRRAPRSGPPLLGVALLVLVAFVVLSAAVHGHPGPFPLLAVFLLLRLGRGPRRPRAVWGPRG